MGWLLVVTGGALLTTKETWELVVAFVRPPVTLLALLPVTLRHPFHARSRATTTIVTR